MRFTGVVRNGVVIPDRPINLPEGARVSIWPANMPLSEDLLKFAGCMEGNYPKDYAQKFEEYKRGKLKE